MKQRIESRGINLDTKCPMCFRMDEDAGHLLFKSKYAQPIWQQLQMEETRIKLSQLDSVLDVFRAILDRNAEEQKKLITILWVLWFERNAVNAGERVKLADKVCYQILRYTSEFQEFCSKKGDKSVKQPGKWRRPASEYLKINFDGWGFIVRYSDGDHAGSGAGHITTASEATHAEAIACLKVILVSKRWNWKWIALL
jgi:hypothetical protein